MFENMIVVAQQNAAPPAGDPNGQAAPNIFQGPLIPMIVIFGVMIFFMFRSQKKQAQQRKDMINSIKSGDAVVTNGGIMGKVTKVKDKTFMLEIADKVQIEIVHAAVGKVAGKEENE